ncbi:MAG: DUF58 domain-containing protein [Dehalococcoidales bacterium]|nr:DUF58 domain-containing protein [Dehalococcoidales bacterium]
MSLVPLAVLITGLFIQSPGRFVLNSVYCVTRVRAGDEIEVKYIFKAGSGLGVFTCFQELPPQFVVTKGNNFNIFWKGWRAAEYDFTYTIRCAKRGKYTFPALRWESNHPLRLTQTREGSLGSPLEITVNPRLLNIRRIRGLPGFASSPFPVIDMAKIGVATTDFREIRDYVYGDPVKNINWKATARSARQGNLPLTNEYEVEGKKAVWIFLDASWFLEVGTSIENAFEYCLEAANGAAYYFLDRGYRVGMYIFNDSKKLIYPDAGRKQYLKISRELLGLVAGKEYDRLPGAVEKCRDYILGYNPLCVVISGLDNRMGDSLIAGVRLLKKLRGRHKHKLPVIFINVAGYNLIPQRETFDRNAAVIMKLSTRPRITGLRSLGASVLDWNPQVESFGNALLKQVKTG